MVLIRTAATFNLRKYRLDALKLRVS
jgi:hypothetical protein